MITFLKYFHNSFRANSFTQDISFQSVLVIITDLSPVKSRYCPQDRHVFEVLHVAPVYPPVLSQSQNTWGALDTCRHVPPCSHLISAHLLVRPHRPITTSVSLLSSKSLVACKYQAFIVLFLSEEKVLSSICLVTRDWQQASDLFRKFQKNDNH